MDYDVFISCKSEDYNYAEEIYEFLTANGLHAFLASKELRKLGESEYRKAITEALKSAYHMVVFASKPEYIDSSWVFYEWDLFIHAKLNNLKKGQLVTVLKGINLKDINFSLCKYESLAFNNYKESILSYLETPNSILRKNKAKEELETNIALVEKLIAKLDADEQTLSSNREKIIKKAEQISDVAVKRKLLEKIDSTGVIHNAHKLRYNSDKQIISSLNNRVRRSENELSNYVIKTGNLETQKKTWIIIFCITTTILIGALGYFVYKYNYTKNTLADSTEQFKTLVDNGVPFTITDIKVGNMTYEGNWKTMPGESIKSEDTNYLTPEIECTSIVNGDYIFKYKLFCNGKLSENESKNKGYSSYEKSIKLQNGTNKFILPNWGSQTKGNWPAGEYKIEIWYNDLCLKYKEFTIL